MPHKGFCKTVNSSYEVLLSLAPANKVIQNFGLLCLSTGIYNPQDLKKTPIISMVSLFFPI